MEVASKLRDANVMAEGWEFGGKQKKTVVVRRHQSNSQ